MLPVRPCGGTLGCENRCALLEDGRIVLLGSLSLSVVFEWVEIEMFEPSRNGLKTKRR